jgi:hypothetical protein
MKKDIKLTKEAILFIYSVKLLSCTNIYFKFDSIRANLGQNAIYSSLCKSAKIPIAQIHLITTAIDFASVVDKAALANF